ncbi:MAG: putative Ig domain-containing protein, partial [Wenzhouxiangella sp.]|nr:putative Ig domain-containing protein [Wenzhouxiangella sp.]
MSAARRFSTILAVLLILATPTTWAQSAGRCIIMVDRFEDQTDLPQFVPVLDQVVAVDNLLTVDLDTSTPVSQDGLIFQLIDRPDGMTIDEFTGVVSWTPDETQLGLLSVTAAVTDSEQRRNRHIFCVSVNGPPTLIAPGNRIAETGNALSIKLFATDPDPDDALTFDLPTAPSGMTVDGKTGQVQWTPDSKGLFDVTARVTDPLGQFDTKEFQIEVTGPIDDGQLGNRAPSLEPIADRQAEVGQPVSIQTIATDPDDDALTFELLAAPAGMTIDGDGLIEFTPVAGQSGPYSVNVRVRDPFELSDSESFVVTIIGINDAPIALDDSYDARRGETLTVPASEGVLANDSDPNDDELSAALETPPQRGSLTLNADGSFDYTPDMPIGTLDAVEKFAVGGVGFAFQQALLADMDDDSIPELIASGFGGIAIVNGEDGSDVARVPGDRSLLGDRALADIDLDGWPEIIIVGQENGRSGTQFGLKLHALEHDGKLKWSSEALPRVFAENNSARSNSDFANAKLTIADIDQDGTPEILVGHGINRADPALIGAGFTFFNHEGRKLFTAVAPGTPQTGQGRVEVVDLDLDGRPEIVTGSAAFTNSGEVIWSLTLSDYGGLNNSRPRAHPIAANLDDDPYPELVRELGNEILVLDHDGTESWRSTIVPSTNCCTPPLAIADIDQDGRAEVLAVSDGNFGATGRLQVLDGLDGSEKWTFISDTTGGLARGGVTAMDLDRDGLQDVVLFNTDRDMIILDGRDGTLKTLIDLPIFQPSYVSLPYFADVDADGAAELVLFGDGTSAAKVFESPLDDWPPQRAIFNQWNYHVTNVNPDATVPAFEQPHWLLPGLNSNRVVGRLPEERTEDFDQFTYAASDGDLSDEATVYLRILIAANPPRILSEPDASATTGFDYRYAPIVTDPDAGETFTFELTASPAGMSIDAATGLLRWRPEATGEFNVGFVVTDSTGLTAAQTWTLEVGEAVEVPDLLGLTEVEAETALIDTDLTVGRVRETFSSEFAAGQIADQSPLPGSVAEFGAEVDLFLSLGLAPEDIDNDLDTFTERQGDCDDADNTIFPGAPDPEGDGIDQNCDGIDGELALTSIELSPAESIVLSNRIIDYQAVGIRADGTAINLNGLGVFDSSDTDIAQLLGNRRVRSAVPGTATISLSHQGVVGEATLTVVAGASLDNEPPTAEITAPVSAEKVTTPIEVIGTADDPNLLRW